MSDSIVQLSPSAVIEAIEGNLVDSSAALGRSEEGVVYLGSDVSWVYTGGAPASRVMRARFTPEDTEDRVAQIHRFFKDWNAPVSWVVGPTSYPPTLGDYLSASGFGSEESLIGMAMDLSGLSAVSMSSDFEIQEVDDQGGLERWLTVDQDDLGAMTVEAERDARCRFFLGLCDGLPIARAMTCLRNDIVGLYGMAISTDSARRSAYAAVANQALQLAGGAGAKIAVTAVSPRMQSLAENLGFKSYCQFNVYQWPPARSNGAIELHA